MVIAAPVPAVRELRDADIPALVALSDVLGAGETLDTWRRRLSEGELVAICAEQDGALVGYAAGSVRRSFGLETAGWIEAFGVANAWRGRRPSIGQCSMARRTIF